MTATHATPEQMLPNTAPEGIIAPAISLLAEANRQQTDGKWLESLAITYGPHIKEWDLAACWAWADWPERETHFPDTTEQDIGIDAVAVRRSDGRHIAIQCKARQLDANGRGDEIHKSELDKFIATSAGDFWAERWLITNGDNRISDNASRAARMSGPGPIKLVNIHADLLAQQDAAPPPEPCPHCQPEAPPETPANPRLYAGRSRRPKRPHPCGNTNSPPAAACPSARPAAKSSCPAAPARPASPSAS